MVEGDDRETWVSPVFLLRMTRMRPLKWQMRSSLPTRGQIEQKGSTGGGLSETRKPLLARPSSDRRLQSGIIMSSITLKIFRVQNMQLYVLSL